MWTIRGSITVILNCCPPSSFIMNRLETRSRQEQLQYLSYRDMLTNLYNRNCYIRFMEGYRGRSLRILVLCILI